MWSASCGTQAGRPTCFSAPVLASKPRIMQRPLTTIARNAEQNRHLSPTFCVPRDLYLTGPACGKTVIFVSNMLGDFGRAIVERSSRGE